MNCLLRLTPNRKNTSTGATRSTWAPARLQPPRTAPTCSRSGSLWEALTPPTGTGRSSHWTTSMPWRRLRAEDLRTIAPYQRQPARWLNLVASVVQVARFVVIDVIIAAVVIVVVVVLYVRIFVVVVVNDVAALHFEFLLPLFLLMLLLFILEFVLYLSLMMLLLFVLNFCCRCCHWCCCCSLG